MQNNTFFGHYQPLPIIVLEKTASTNDYSKQLLTKFKPQVDFTAIMAKHQTQGRGQRGTTWLTNACTNMTASFIYSPHKLSIIAQFRLTIHVSLAVYDVIQEISKKRVYIKWPNDIMIGNKKVAGILIENKVSGSAIKTSVIGIGINVYEKDFPQEIAHKTTSLALANNEIDMTILDIVKKIQLRLTHYKKLFEKEDFAVLLDLYNSHLFLRYRNANFLVDQQSVTGKIIGVEEDGLLQIMHQNTLVKYDLKDIVYQL